MKKSNLFWRTGFLLLSIALLSSCGYLPKESLSTGSPLSPATAPVSQSHGTTPSPIPTGSPATQPAFTSNGPNANDQVYLDPQGWYTVKIPAEWQREGNSGHYSGKDGFFETGYLPDMMFIDQNVVICQWMANISTRNTYSISWLGTIGNSCQLISLPGVSPASIMEVIINPSADFPQRVFYLKADPDHFNEIASTFSWLQPVDEKAKLNYQTAPLRSSDQYFWDNTEPLPPGLSVTEYQLPPEAQAASPAEEIFYHYLSPEILAALPEVERSDSTYVPKSQERINNLITPFGYELRAGKESYLYDLYQNGTLAIENIHKLPDVYLDNASGDQKLAFFAHTAIDHEKSFYDEGNAACYLVENETIRLWENKYPNPMLTQGRPIWIGEDLLILGLGESTDLQVRNRDYDLLYSFNTYFGTHIPVKEYLAWDNHWILGVSSFIIQDGKTLNETMGFEEVFNLYLMNNKPFFFFRKGPRAGISYDGQFLSSYYHEIVHGYCCGLALNNPMVRGNAITFYGNRDGIWYLVVVEIN
jgi:hypothetical protein